MTHSPALTPLEFELCVRKADGAPPDAPIVPPSFQRTTGSWPAIVAQANRLNDVQKGLPAPHYFFFPEATPAEYDRLHCDMCKRIAAREAKADD